MNLNLKNFILRGKAKIIINLKKLKKQRKWKEKEQLLERYIPKF